MELDLAFIWAGLIAFSILVYVILDGFDLGVGILFPFAKSEKERGVMMNSIAPVWDGNETWLVLGGGGLFAVFPLAYAVVMPALYIPITLMLLALVFRGVAFEYRWRGAAWQKFWDRAFFGGSTLAAFCQGVSLGALVQGIEVTGRAYSGGWWDWLTPFSVLTGVAVLVGYALLGATWLYMKTDGPLQLRMHRYAYWAAVGTLVSIFAVSVITPFLEPTYFARWFNLPGSLFSVMVPALVLGTAWLLFSGLRDHKDRQPFIAALALFALSFVGIGISFYPMMVPPSLTIWQAAAPDSSLAFTLIGAAILIPIILLYTGYAYWVFRGKVDPQEGYH